MLGLKMTKKGWGSDSDNVRSRSKSRERVSLLGSRNGNSRGLSNGGLRGQEGRRRIKGEQEMVSLLGRPSPGKLKKRDFGRRKPGRSILDIFKVKWTKRTYVALLVITAFLTFKIFRGGAKLLKWDEYENLLEPKAPQGKRCFEDTIEIISHVTGKSRTLPCSCPVPNLALENKDDSLWRSNHERMVSEAQNARDDLDIVFFGDGMVEQLSGSRGLGKEMMNGMEDYFETTFRKNRGGKYNALALGSSGDTVGSYKAYSKSLIL